MDSVDPNNLSSSSIIQCPVRVVTDHVEFLRVHVNDPTRQALVIDNILHDFTFPLLHTHSPLPLLRRIVSQMLVSRIRPRLAFQPLHPSDADRLQHYLASQVHDYLRFPFQFNSDLLSLPLPLGGFDFPSLSRLNSMVAVSGLVRDLNHHVPLFRQLALITWADWTCLLNSCRDPLQSPSSSRSFSRAARSLPWAWIIAHDALRKLNVSILHTDQSYLLQANISIRHAAKLSPSPLPPRTVSHLASAGFQLLSDLGHWGCHP